MPTSDDSSWWFVLAAVGGGLAGFLGQLVLDFIRRLSHLYVRRVLPGQAGILIRHGQPHKVLGPGLYWYLPGVYLVEVIDTCLEVHESDWTPLLTRDGKSLSVKWKLKCQVSDPVKAQFGVWDAREAITDEVGAAVFRNLSDRTLAEISSDYESIGDELDELVIQAADSIGYSVVHFGFTGMAQSRPLHLLKDLPDTLALPQTGD